jgi:hypothetical protein
MLVRCRQYLHKKITLVIYLHLQIILPKIKAMLGV